MSHSYPSDIRRPGCPVWSARRPLVYFLCCTWTLKSGCQWRMLRTSPIGAPATSISGNGASGLARVRIPFWSKLALARSGKAMVGRADQLLHRGLPSVKNTDYPQEGVGIKRHIAVDTQGLPHAIFHQAGALAMFDRRRDGLSQVPRSTGVTPPFATAVGIGSLGGSGETQRTATFGVAPG